MTEFIVNNHWTNQNYHIFIGSGGSRKFWWGGFEAKTSKIRMSSPKLRVIFRPKSEIQTFFSPKIRWSPKKKNKKNKKKKVFTKIETDFSAGFVTFRSVGGGDASRNGAELFKIRANFSAKIVTFRLVGGGCIPPPKSATVYRYHVHLYIHTNDRKTNYLIMESRLWCNLINVKQ